MGLKLDRVNGLKIGFGLFWILGLKEFGNWAKGCNGFRVLTIGLLQKGFCIWTIEIIII